MSPFGAARCRLCGEALANAACHVPTPELSGFNGEAVFYCIPSGKHVTRRATWAEDVLASARSLRRSLRSLRGRT